MLVAYVSRQMGEHSRPLLRTGLACLSLIVGATTVLSGQERPGPELANSSGSGSPARNDWRFEVASIRPGDPNGLIVGPRVPSSPRRFVADSTTIPSLASKAFDLKHMFEMEFPSWMKSARFNVMATIPEGAAKTDLPVMIRRLLEDRFGLVYHREVRHMAGYQLVVAKSGPKLAKSELPSAAVPGPGDSDIEVKNGRPQFTKGAGSGHLVIAIGGATEIFRGRSKTMKNLADDLARKLDAPVNDETGLEGEYDYTLTFAPEPRASPVDVVFPPNAAPAPARNEDEVTALPSLRDALQSQLGLKLQPVKDVGVEVVVLDSAKKTPTEN